MTIYVGHNFNLGMLSKPGLCERVRIRWIDRAYAKRTLGHGKHVVHVTTNDANNDMNMAKVLDELRCYPVSTVNFEKRLTLGDRVLVASPPVSNAEIWFEVSLLDDTQFCYTLDTGVRQDVMEYTDRLRELGVQYSQIAACLNNRGEYHLGQIVHTVDRMDLGTLIVRYTSAPSKQGRLAIIVKLALESL